MDIYHYITFIGFGVSAYLMHQGHRALRRFEAQRQHKARLAQRSRVELDILACQRETDRLTAKAIKAPLSKAESTRMRELLRREASLREAASGLA